MWSLLWRIPLTIIIVLIGTAIIYKVFNIKPRRDGLGDNSPLFIGLILFVVIGPLVTGILPKSLMDELNVSLGLKSPPAKSSPAVSAPADAKLALPSLSADFVREAVAYLDAHRPAPEYYVIDKFLYHDVVFIGEYHRIKENVDLVQRLIPLAYRNGVFTLCTEFARRVDQPLLDRLTRGATYDESLARQITFNQFCMWGFHEYVNVFKAAWGLNHSLPAGARPFRILALNNSPDWSFVKTQEDRDNPEILRKVWHGEDESHWAQVILDEVIAKGEKALVYSGMHHAFTEYRQPIAIEGKFVRFGDVRLGNHVFNRIGKRAITIYLHAGWVAATGYDQPVVYPVEGVIDALMAELGPGYYPVGFDTHGSPFGELPASDALYHFGYEIFTLTAFCDGYIFQKPISRYRGVTPIQDFITEANLEQARQQSPNPHFRSASVSQFNEAIGSDTDLSRHFGHLH